MCDKLESITRRYVNHANTRKEYSIILFCLLIFLCLPVLPLAAEPVTLTDDTDVIHLGTHIYILEDPAGSLAAADVMSPGSISKFKKSKAPNPSFGFTPSVYWVRVPLVSRCTDRKKWLLELNYPLMDYIDLFIVENEKVVVNKTYGTLYPFYERDMHHRNFIFEIHIDPGATRTLYMKFRNMDRMEFQLILRSPEEFYRYIYSEQYILGIYYGFLLVMFLFNLLFFLSVRDVSYLYYIIYILAMGVFQLGQNGYLYLALSNLQDPPPVHFISLTQAFLIASIFQFSQSYLDTRHNAPRIHAIMQALKIAGLLSLTCPLYLDYTTCIKIGVALAMVMIPVIIIAGAVIMRQGYRPAYYYMAAWSVMFFAGTVFLLRSIAVVPLNTFTYYILHFGTSIEVVLLSLGLGDRYNRVKQERDRISNELDMAKRIHGALLPGRDPVIEGIVSHIEYIPADEMGGDLYDYHMLGVNKMGVLMCDVSGHGFPAALVASMVKIAFSLQIPHANDPEKVIDGMRMILAKELKNTFVTACYTIIDVENSQLVTANSGHLPIFIYKRSSGDLVELSTKGPCISTLPAKSTGSRTFPLSGNDRIIIYTDGITECRDGNGELYGTDQFKEFITRNKDLNATQFSHTLIADLHRWKRGGPSFSDDITLLVIDIL